MRDASKGTLAVSNTHTRASASTTPVTVRHTSSCDGSSCDTSASATPVTRNKTSSVTVRHTTCSCDTSSGSRGAPPAGIIAGGEERKEEKEWGEKEEKEGEKEEEKEEEDMQEEDMHTLALQYICSKCHRTSDRAHCPVCTDKESVSELKLPLLIIHRDPAHQQVEYIVVDYCSRRS